MEDETKKKFSIILPVRNGGDYVKLCMASLLAQTLPDFNIIVLDNYSTDGTLEYIQSLADDRINLYPSLKPLTIEENWGRIAEVSKNEFMTLIGHDDILFPGYLAEMERLIQQYPGASLYQAHFTYIDARGALMRTCKPMAEIEDGALFLTTILQNKIDIMGTGFMMRSADFNRLGGMPFYPNLLFADLELWLNFSDISFKATSIQECFSFRLHQSTTHLAADLSFQQAFEQFVYFLASLKQRSMRFDEIIKKYSLTFLLFYCQGLTHRLLRTPKNKRGGVSVKRFLQKCRHYAILLTGHDTFKPTAVPAIFMAKILDSTALGRAIFLFFKRIYKKPLLKYDK